MLKVISEKQDNMKIESLLDKSNPTNATAPKGITNIYKKEQLEYIQAQINKVRNLVKDRQS